MTDTKIKGILGTKLGMTQVFDENNRVVPVTVVKAGPNVVTQIRTEERDGYSAVQLAFGAIDPRKVNKPTSGQFAKAGVTPRRHVVELRVADTSEYEVGQELTAEVFEDGAYVDVTGTSKGKGFAGTMKRHGFAGQVHRTVHRPFTVAPVPSVVAPLRAACSRACACPAAWVATASRRRTSPFTRWTPRTACC